MYLREEVTQVVGKVVKVSKSYSKEKDGRCAWNNGHHHNSNTSYLRNNHYVGGCSRR